MAPCISRVLFSYTVKHCELCYVNNEDFSHFIGIFCTKSIDIYAVFLYNIITTTNLTKIIKRRL